VSTKEELPRSLHHILDSVVLTLLKIFLVAFVIETAYALLLLTLVITDIGDTNVVASMTVLWFLHTVKFVIEIWIILRMIAEKLSTHYYINDSTLVVYRGVTNQAETIYNLEHLKNIEVHQTWLGRHLHYGDIHLVLSSSGYKEDVNLYGVNDPRKYERLLRVNLQPNSNVPA